MGLELTLTDPCRAISKECPQLVRDTEMESIVSTLSQLRVVPIITRRAVDGAPRIQGIFRKHPFGRRPHSQLKVVGGRSTGPGHVTVAAAVDLPSAGVYERWFGRQAIPIGPGQGRERDGLLATLRRSLCAREEDGGCVWAPWDPHMTGCGNEQDGRSGDSTKRALLSHKQ